MDITEKTIKDVLLEAGFIAEIAKASETSRYLTYNITLNDGTLFSRFQRRRNDILYALGLYGVATLNPLPARSTIELLITKPDSKILTINDYNPEGYILPVIYGQNAQGQIKVIDLVKQPHLLIAGQTGSGKSVFINNLICNLIKKYDSKYLQLQLFDFKGVEFNEYKNIPHLRKPVIKETLQALFELENLELEMIQRFLMFTGIGARNITEYNETTAIKLPYIIVIIDEIADLFSVGKKTAEKRLIKLAQMARAAGIHLVLCTQRPSRQVFNQTVKANIPARIAFTVTSATESRIILDCKGAENLQGKGEMMYINSNMQYPERLQAPYIDSKAIVDIIATIK